MTAFPGVIETGKGGEEEGSIKRYSYEPALRVGEGVEEVVRELSYE